MKSFLLIDTAGEPARIGLATGDFEQLPNRGALAGELLRRIDALLHAHHIKLSELTGIGVVVGPGSFTGLRLGIAAANALAWSHKLPAVAVTAEEAATEDSFRQIVTDRLAAGETSRTVMPEYGRPPSITPPNDARRKS